MRWTSSGAGGRWGVGIVLCGLVGPVLLRRRRGVSLVFRSGVGRAAGVVCPHRRKRAACGALRASAVSVGARGGVGLFGVTCSRQTGPPSPRGLGRWRWACWPRPGRVRQAHPRRADARRRWQRRERAFIPRCPAGHAQSTTPPERNATPPRAADKRPPSTTPAPPTHAPRCQSPNDRSPQAAPNARRGPYAQRSDAGASRIRSTRAGAPATTASAGMSLVMTVLVPITQLSPTVAPRRKQAP